MPAKKSLEKDVLPMLWTGLKLDPSETERALNMPTYDRIMIETDTIASKSVRDRLWMRLGASDYARLSPYAYGVLLLDVRAVRIAIIGAGHPEAVNTHITHTHNTHISEGSQ